MVKSDIFENLQNCFLIIVYFDQQNALNKIQQSTSQKTLRITHKVLYITTMTVIKNKSTSAAPGSSVGIATDYGLDGPGIESRWGKIFRPSRPPLGPTQPPVQWVSGLSRG